MRVLANLTAQRWCAWWAGGCAGSDFLAKENGARIGRHTVTTLRASFALLTVTIDTLSNAMINLFFSNVLLKMSHASAVRTKHKEKDIQNTHWKRPEGPQRNMELPTHGVSSPQPYTA